MEPGFVLLLGGMLGAGVFVLLRVAERWTAQGAIPRDFRRWHDELELRALQAIQADLHAAEARARLVALIGEIPQDFDPTALLAVNVAAGVHRAALEHAERAGIVRPGSFARVYGEPPTYSSAPSPDPELGAIVVVEREERDERRPRWENGRLVVR